MTLLGKVVGGPIAANEIEIWGVPDEVTEVRFVTDELQAVCPVTQQPDTYHAEISVEGRTFESKALKHYLWGFRDLPISAEDLAGMIAADLSKQASAPVWVKLRQNVRGGLQITVMARAKP